jgi:putative endonuclease
LIVTARYKTVALSSSRKAAASVEACPERLPCRQSKGALLGMERRYLTSDWMFHCYMVRCSDSKYYVGHTDDIDRRLAEHQSGAFGGFTHKRRPVELVWNEAFQTRDDAKAAEKQVKGWSRAKKEALIRRDWTVISELAKCRSRNR